MSFAFPTFSIPTEDLQQTAGAAIETRRVINDNPHSVACLSDMDKATIQFYCSKEGICACVPPDAKQLGDLYVLLRLGTDNEAYIARRMRAILGYIDTQFRFDHPLLQIRTDWSGPTPRWRCEWMQDRNPLARAGWEHSVEEAEVLEDAITNVILHRDAHFHYQFAIDQKVVPMLRQLLGLAETGSL